MKIIKPAINVTADHAVVWQDKRLFLLDQRVLPDTEQFIELHTAEETAAAIAEMVVRGAPAIGVTAAYGVVLAAREAFDKSGSEWKQAIEPLLQILEQARPTAVNLSWAIDKMRSYIKALDSKTPEAFLTEKAIVIHQEDIAANRAIGDYGASLIEQDSGIITHCNAGALATGGYGTALGVVRSVHKQGKLKQVFADETRPWLQGARLTAWELVRDNIPVILLADGAAASRMAAGGVDWVVVGSDRIAGNGDVANKIGTFHLILAAKYHGINVMVAAPTSTVDMSLASGNDIPIEERDPQELLACGNKRIAAEGVPAWNPVFDVTPASLVDAIVTEKGIVLEPDAEKMQKHMA
ncbi:MAG: S-methyl-5-thioribose-1-phosphate isomerase [Gammaproteobacteria bacterium]|nr:S-methyl-5-thioribose-1-phosphate isomerase [Gammaproteobacteria bacterium]